MYNTSFKIIYVSMYARDIHTHIYIYNYLYNGGIGLYDKYVHTPLN